MVARSRAADSVALTTLTDGGITGALELRFLRAVPGVIALESPVEVEHTHELVAGVLRLAEEKAEVD
jgi:hypothetical protein